VPARTLIIGCGYIGLPLALCLQRKGHEVSGWVRSAASTEALKDRAFHQLIVGSVADATIWEGVEQKYDFVIHCASSGRGGEAAYEEVFLRGARMMDSHQPQAPRILISSTSVYGQAQGEIVTEESVAAPGTPTSRILREAEEATLESGTTIVRSAGIYGPGRSVLLEKLRRDEAMIEGDGQRWINQIHQRDLTTLLAHLIEVGAPGEIYNAADDTPVTQLDYYAWCSEFLHKPMPPIGPINVNRKRGVTNKRVSNAKLRATGWMPIYPSFREGLAADYSPK
jgi:nucleoside-diphosphate-sugar epimerase